MLHESDEGPAAGCIVEVEAYRGPADRAAHSAGGRRTPRNEVMWGPAGRAYVYFVYGMHWCLNVVAGRAGCPEAVLLRGMEPLEGLELMRRRRGPRVRDALLLRGPANLCKALGIDGSLNGAAFDAGPLRLLDAPAVPLSRLGRSPRIGVAYAGEDAQLPWRLYLKGSPGVSGPAVLRPA